MEEEEFTAKAQRARRGAKYFGDEDRHQPAVDKGLDYWFASQHSVLMLVKVQISPVSLTPRVEVMEPSIRKTISIFALQFLRIWPLNSISRFVNIQLVAILITMGLLGGVVSGKSLEEETPVLVQSLVKQLLVKKRTKVATLDFTNVQGQANELGRLVAEQIAVDLVTSEGITVLDRANISAVMAEHSLTTEGLVKPENAKKLGQFAGVDALVVGSLASSGESFTLTVKVISTETAEVVAAGRCKFLATEDMMKQFSAAIADHKVLSKALDNSLKNGATIEEIRGIASKKMENLEIVLIDVAPSKVSMTSSYGTTYDVPAIKCSFNMYNRDLRNSIVLAANGANVSNRRQVQIDHVIAEISDSNGEPWSISAGFLKGMATIMGFERIKPAYEMPELRQNNTDSIAEYIKKGKKAEFGNLEQRAIGTDGKYWVGSFTVIPPGENIRVSARLIPNTTFNPNNPIPSLPQSFQFSMQILFGSLSGEQEPEACKNFKLKNLTFDKIVMP